MGTKPSEWVSARASAQGRAQLELGCGGTVINVSHQCVLAGVHVIVADIVCTVGLGGRSLTTGNSPSALVRAESGLIYCASAATGGFQEDSAMLKRLSLLWTVLRGDARQLWFALRHPAAPAWLKVGVALIVAYVLSPVDLIPDVLPIIGAVDDLVLVPLAIRWLVRRLPAEIVQAASKRAGPLG
jgi:uncharacterized membrane protein YkvA (DUF1232 family)